MTKKKVQVIHKAPGKKGKQEYREFKSVQEALDYVDRNNGKRLGKKKD